MESKGRQIHGEAANARERGESIESLKLTDEAIKAYQEEGDLLGLAEVLVDRSITFRHLYDASGDKNYLVIAKHEAQAGVEIARKSNQKEALPIPLARLANVQTDLGEFDEATKNYQEAVEAMSSNPPSQHNRPAVVVDMKAHLATTEYKSGDKSALERAEKALSELEQTDEADYNKHVWVSGAHMRIAEMLINDDPQKAKEHLQKAKEIIDADPSLTIRAQQWEKLAQKFS